jgi:hypothetical protein
MLVYPRVAGGILHDAWHSPVWSAECLPGKFGASIWWWWELSCFISITWCGEDLHRQGVQGIEVLILLGALFLPLWLQCLSKVFYSWSTHCLLLHPSCHLGSSPKNFLNENYKPLKREIKEDIRR